MSQQQTQSSPGQQMPQQSQESGPGPNPSSLAENLLSWFSQNGGWLSPDVKIGYSDLHGFHVRAIRPLSSPSVASCPLKLTLSSLNLDPLEKDVIHVDSPLRQCKGKIPDHILTYLLLIEQRNKGIESPWYAYIACLPGLESMTTPLWFDEPDMLFLAGTSLAPAAQERKEEMVKQYEHALSVLEQHSITLAGDFSL